MVQHDWKGNKVDHYYPLEEMTEQQLREELRHADRWRINAAHELRVAENRCKVVRDVLNEKFNVFV